MVGGAFSRFARPSQSGKGKDTTMRPFLVACVLVSLGRVPLEAHSLQIVAPATSAQEVLYFI